MVQYWSIATTFGFVPFLLFSLIRKSSIPFELESLPFRHFYRICHFVTNRTSVCSLVEKVLGCIQNWISLDLFMSTCALVSFNLCTVAIHTFFFFLFVKIGFPYIRRNKSKNIIFFCFMFIIQLEKTLFAKNYFFNIRRPDTNSWRGNLIEIGIMYYTTV